MSLYIFYGHSYHLELNQLLSFRICFPPSLCVCVCLSLWMWMDEFLSGCTEWLIRKLPLAPPVLHPSPRVSMPSHSSPPFSSASCPYVIYLLRPPSSLSSLYFLTFPVSLTLPLYLSKLKEIYTHCTISLVLLLPGNIVFCCPNKKRQSQWHIAWRETGQEISRDDDKVWHNTWTSVSCLFVPLRCCCQLYTLHKGFSWQSHAGLESAGCYCMCGPAGDCGHNVPECQQQQQWAAARELAPHPVILSFPLLCDGMWQTISPPK